MANFTPQGNIQAAAIAAFIAPVIEHICTANGIVIPPDASAALPGALAVLVAYATDVFTPSASESASGNQSRLLPRIQAETPES